MKLGQKVKFGAAIYRRREGRSRRWVRIEFAGEGVLVGLRNLTNGEMVSDYDGYYGSHRYYEAQETFRAAIVATHLWQKPVYVPVEDLEVVE